MTRRTFSWTFAVVALNAVACDRCSDHPAATDAASAAPVEAAVATTSAAGTASTPASVASGTSGTAVVAAPLGDAGAACPIVFGPKQLPFTGTASITPAEDGVDIVFLVAGAPKVVHEATPKVTKEPARELALPGTPMADPGPGCAAAGTHAFCMDRDGAIQRTPLSGGERVTVGRAKPGTRLGAASAGGETIVAFLAERKTSEGLTTEAWIVGNGTPLTRISEDGAGATFVAGAPAAADKIVALYIDGRRGMTPIHGVALSARGGKIKRDKDDVLFVAAGAETYTAGALATSADGHASALVPIAHDVGFGLLATRFGVVADEHWSDYPNGLDPAPIAATALGPGDPFALRVRPAEARFGAPRLLELGRVTAAGFAALGSIPTHDSPRDVAVTTDPGDALAVVFTDATGTWLERLRCP
ncbi:hypothetical protein BH09MYX1_BH09MYX1_15160 [soil metagenome]